MISRTFFRHFRWQFIIGFLVVWNFICGLGIWLNGGLGAFKTPASALVGALAAAALALVALLTLLHPGFRWYVLVSDAPFNQMRIDFVLLVLLGTFGSVMAAYDVWRLLP